MSSVKALTMLLRIKRRRVQQFEEAVQARLEEQRRCELQQEEADAAETRCRDDEQACEHKILGLAESGGFRASDIVTLQHVLATLKARTQQAAAAATAAAERVQQAIHEVALARQALRRAESQVEFIDNRRRALLQAIEREQEDTQDEEAEEASVARILAARAAEELELQDVSTAR